MFPCPINPSTIEQTSGLCVYSKSSLAVNPMRPFSNIHHLYEKLRHLRGAIIVVEGIIGSGKTSLGKGLTKMIGDAGIPCQFFEEEVNMELLTLFLSNMKKYAFVFQLFMLKSRQDIYRRALEFSRGSNGVSIIDRSLHGDIAFAQMHVTMGNINEDEWEVYSSIVKSSSLPEPTVVIYLQVTPETAMSRIHRRDRNGEKDAYTIDYLQDLDGSYRIALEESNDRYHPIDWNDDRILSEEELLDVLENIDV